MYTKSARREPTTNSARNPGIRANRANLLWIFFLGGKKVLSNLESRISEVQTKKQSSWNRCFGAKRTRFFLVSFTTVHTSGVILVYVEGTGTQPYYLANCADQKNEGPL